MKKLVTTLTASALLMGSLATAVSAAETTETPATPTTPVAVPATTTATTPNDVTANFIGNQNGFSFPIPAYWDSRVTNTEYLPEQLTSMGESGVYLVNFTYTPEVATASGSTDPVKFASIRGYDRTAWEGISDKAALGTVLNETGDVIYVLEPVTANPFTFTADQERFSELLQGVRTGISSNFNTTVVPTIPGTPSNPATPTTPGTEVPVDTDGPAIPNDPSKVSTNPTPNIELTSMTPFYKSPGGTMIGYLGPQKLDTTGNGQTDPASGQWVEIYTWMGLAWIVVE